MINVTSVFAVLFLEESPLPSPLPEEPPIDPSRVTWVVIGDLAKIEQPIRDLKLGEVQVLDADGKVLR